MKRIGSDMMKSIKKILGDFFPKGSIKAEPAYPAGSADTSSLHEQLLQLAEELDSRLAADIDAYRQTFLCGFYRYGYFPDFSVQNTADLYLLRQGCSYALEYFMLYRIVLNALLAEGIKEAKSYVFGCGSMIDAVGMCLAADTFSERPVLSYTGIDPQAWSKRFDAPVERSYIGKKMQDYWADGEPFDGNIILFAKVLNEIREGSGDFERFCDGFRKTELTQDTVFLCVSGLNKTGFQYDWQEPDWSRMQKIIGIFLEKGYSFKAAELPAELAANPCFFCEDIEADDGTPYPYCYLTGTGTRLYIEDFAPDFALPEQIGKYLDKPGNIRRRCSFYAEREKKYLRIHPEARPEETDAKTVCTECCPVRCRPEARTAYYDHVEMCFQVLKFQRDRQITQARPAARTEDNGKKDDDGTP